MDDHTPPPPVIDQAYAFLAGINRWLGGTRATLQRFGELGREWQPGQRIQVLEVACGGGDFGPALIRWGRTRGVDIHVTALDLSLAALHIARQRMARTKEASDVQLVCGDVHALPYRDDAFDYVVCALFFHHLTDDDAISALRTFDRLARHGIVVNDLVRHWGLYAWTWLLTRPCNAVLRNDGPLSVRRAFRPKELAGIARQAGMDWLTVRRHPGFRMTLAGARTTRNRSVARAAAP